MNYKVKFKSDDICLTDEDQNIIQAMVKIIGGSGSVTQYSKKLSDKTLIVEIDVPASNIDGLQRLFSCFKNYKGTDINSSTSSSSRSSITPSYSSYDGCSSSSYSRRSSSC